ncbi:MAG: ATP synthase F0 subunit A [Omnitrophica bacterium RIFCSPHIGHO2_02_FULL_46_11]|nr:MAG: ATP synthase F0 subunit A [Omnitrophica bacterium RIFCSPLOWO2_01_FULL_45_10b]OGW87842.1 MAG: ATP synthase F0 subunit A [Omnitrophica bacterium RIFCSPHIGHO2_02_FULL_46_11]
MIEETAHSAAHKAAASHEAAHEGLKELANWITLVNERWHDVPFVNVLHQWENVVFSLTAAFFLIILSFFATRKKSLIPGPLQNVLELAVESFENLVTGIMGPRGRAYVPFIATLFIYILTQNFMGLVPGLKAPTSSLNTTVGLAICVFFYVQGIGIKQNGIFGYIHHLMGSPHDIVGWIMVPLNFPLHILQELIKPMSLSLRLFGNILGEDSLIAAFVGLGILSLSFIHSPIGLPLQFPFFLLSMLLGTIQALVFSLLSTIYISLMLPSSAHETA